MMTVVFNELGPAEEKIQKENSWYLAETV